MSPRLHPLPTPKVPQDQVLRVSQDQGKRYPKSEAKEFPKTKPKGRNRPTPPQG